MGVDAKLVLPGNVEVDKVAKVMGVLAGLKPEQYEIERSDGLFVRVDGVKVEASGTFSEMVEIVMRPPDGSKLIDGEMSHFCYYHFEHGKYRLASGRSTPFWIALFRRVADFFGGRVDYKDCDDKKDNYRVKFKSDAENCPQDDEPWDNFHRRLLDLQPLTKDDLQAVAKYAIYQIGLD